MNNNINTNQNGMNNNFQKTENNQYNPNTFNNFTNNNINNMSNNNIQGNQITNNNYTNMYNNQKGLNNFENNQSINNNYNNVNNSVYTNNNIENEQNNILNDSENKEKNKKIVIIIGIALIAIIVVLIIIKLFSGNNLKNGSDFKTINVNQSEKFKIKNKYNNLIVKVNSIEKNKTIKSKVSLKENTYTKIKLTIENKDNKEHDTTMAHNFSILDSNKNKIANCNSGYWLDAAGIEENNDGLPSSIGANQSVSGYIYCETDKTDISYILITALSYLEVGEDDSVKGTTDEYYVKLNQ